MNKKIHTNQDAGQDVGTEKTISRGKKGTSQRGLRKGFTRVTFIIKSENLEKIRYLSEVNQRSVLKIINQIFDLYLSDKKFVKIPAKKSK